MSSAITGLPESYWRYMESKQLGVLRPVTSQPINQGEQGPRSQVVGEEGDYPTNTPSTDLRHPSSNAHSKPRFPPDSDTANAVEGARKIVQLKQRLYNYDLRASTSEIASKVSCCQCSPSVKVCEKSEYKRLMQQNSVLLIVQELCESRGGRPGLSVLTSLLVSVDVKIY